MEQVPDVLKSAANAYKLLMENEKVRVLIFWLNPAKKHQRVQSFHIINIFILLSFAGIFNIFKDMVILF